jgi:anti-sigma B factor antagonist
MREREGLNVLDAVGEIDIFTTPAFKSAVYDVISRGQKQLIINMEQVAYMDSSGFGALLGATKQLRPAGGKVNLVKCNRPISRMLRITRLDTIFGVYSSEDEAMDDAKQKVSAG